MKMDGWTILEATELLPLLVQDSRMVAFTDILGNYVTWFILQTQKDYLMQMQNQDTLTKANVYFK